MKGGGSGEEGYWWETSGGHTIERPLIRHIINK